MSLTARERHNPPPRRKSCAACIKAKRRCDAAAPACARCTQRQIPCEYPRASGRYPRPSAAWAELSPSDVLSGDGSLDGPQPEPRGLLAEDHVCSAAAVTEEAVFGDLSVFEVSLDENPALGLAQHSSVLVAPTIEVFDAVSALVEERLRYAVEVILEAPSSMVLETQTPWCHPQLYKDGMPRSMRDAHSSCALYMAKTPVNGPVILRSIESHVRDLLDAPTPLTPEESLAHTQSLILYQIIRLFDGDIGARASAERAIPALETSALCLLPHIRFDAAAESAQTELPLHPLGPTKSFWAGWVFQESARRTLLLAFYFLQAYRLLSGQRDLQCDGKLGLVHSWTLSAHLWRARSPVAFAEAWRDRKHFVVTNADFRQVFEEAQADDIDLFGEMLLTSVIGFDDAQGWFASRGGVLRDTGQRTMG